MRKPARAPALMTDGEHPSDGHGNSGGTQQGAGSLKTTAKGSDRRRAAADPEQVTFRWVIHTVTGDRGREVRAAQARAIKELLRWLDNQSQDTS